MQAMDQESECPSSESKRTLIQDASINAADCEVLGLPAVAHFLLTSVTDFLSLAQCNTILSSYYGGSRSFVKHVLNSVLGFVATETGRREVRNKAAQIMGKNDFGIHPKMACLAGSFKDLQKKLVAHFIQAKYKELLEASTLEKRVDVVLTCGRLGGHGVFLWALFETLTPMILAQSDCMSKIAAEAWFRCRRL